MSFFANPNPNNSSGGDGGGSIPTSADKITFNKSSTSLDSGNVQGAIKELDDKNITQDNIISNIQNEQYKIKSDTNDASPGYLINKIDNKTLQIKEDKLIANIPDAASDTKGAVQLSGDLGNPLSTASTPQLTETGVVAGSYDVASVQIDSKGRIENATSAIDDDEPGTNKVYSSSKVQSKLDAKADSLHNHNLSDLEDVDVTDRDDGKVLVWNEQLGKHVYIVVSSEHGDGDFEGTVEWENITNKPQAYPPTEHNHDDRYWTKEQAQDHVDFVQQLMEQEQGKVASHASDTPDYLQNKVDGTTITIEGSELTAKGLDGLSITPQQINTQLAGGNENIPTQINDILDMLASLGRPLKWLADVETHADMMAITTMQDSDFVIVFNDETKDNDRTWYAYHGDLAMWRYMGSLGLTNKFTSLVDTPSAFDDGKILRSGTSGLYYDTIKYNEIVDRPNCTKTQIEATVDRAHEHSNAESLAKLGVNENEELTINGVVYAPKQQERKFLQAYRTTDVSLTGANTIVFNNHRAGTISYNSTTGHFTVEEGKSYVVTCNVVMDNISGEGSSIPFFLIDAETDAIPAEIYAAGLCTQSSGLGSFTAVFTAESTRELKVRTSLDEAKSYRIRHRYTALSVYEF